MKDFRNPMAVLGGTFVSPGLPSFDYADARAYRALGDHTDPEILEDEERVRIGKRHHGACIPERWFVPAPSRKGNERVVNFPRKATCHCLRPVVAKPLGFQTTDDKAERFVRLADDGMTLPERIALLLERRASMVYTVFETAKREHRETILFALIAAIRLLEPETKAKVARQVRHFPADGSFVPQLIAACA